MRDIPLDILFPFLKKEEGCVLRAYDDLHPLRVLKPGDKINGTLTAGIGHTGPDVQIGMKVTTAMAKAWLAEDLKEAREKLYARISNVVDELSTHQYAALLSFVFNLGANSKWGIWKVITSRHFEQVPQQMMKYVNAKVHGELRKMEGLVKRRAAEVVLWSTDEPGISVAPVPSSAMRATETPPTPANPSSPAKAPNVIAGVVATVATVPVAAKQVTDAVAPWAEQSPVVGQIIAVVATLAAVAAIVGVVLSWLKQRKA